MLMLILFLLGALALVSVMIFLLHRRVRRYQGFSNSSWILFTVMAWAFLWVGERIFIRNWGNAISDTAHLVLFFLTISLCLLVYGFVFWRIGYVAERKKVEQQMEEIGKEEAG